MWGFDGLSWCLFVLNGDCYSSIVVHWCFWLVLVLENDKNVGVSCIDGGYWCLMDNVGSLGV